MARVGSRGREVKDRREGSSIRSEPALQWGEGKRTKRRRESRPERVRFSRFEWVEACRQWMQTQVRATESTKRDQPSSHRKMKTLS
eukprot:6489728-Amphidinium_carterae.1